MKSYVTALSFVTIYVVCACLLPDPKFGIRINVSRSVPYTIFFSKPIHSIHRGQYVTISHPKSSVPLVKKIIGLPGDSIEIKEGHLIVNNEEHGFLMNQSKSRHSLTPIQQQQIPEDYLFAYASHEESFDSRYQEFGLIKQKQVKETLCPVL